MDIDELYAKIEENKTDFKECLYLISEAYSIYRIITRGKQLEMVIEAHERCALSHVKSEIQEIQSFAIVGRASSVQSALEIAKNQEIKNIILLEDHSKTASLPTDLPLPLMKIHEVDRSCTEIILQKPHKRDKYKKKFHD